jgi:hypothetical protein
MTKSERLAIAKVVRAAERCVRDGIGHWCFKDPCRWCDLTEAVETLRVITKYVRPRRTKGTS